MHCSPPLSDFNGLQRNPFTRYNSLTKPHSDPAGYYWFPGYDLKPLDTPDLISLLTNTSCYPGSPCGSCRFNISAVGCGIDGGQFHGVSKLPKDCAVLCDSLAGCGCTSFVHDVTYSGTGCCYLKNATVASLTISPSYNAFVRKG